jgi:hypothetical protein
MSSVRLTKFCNEVSVVVSVVAVGQCEVDFVSDENCGSVNHPHLLTLAAATVSFSRVRDRELIVWRVE